MNHPIIKPLLKVSTVFFSIIIIPILAKSQPLPGSASGNELVFKGETRIYNAVHLSGNKPKVDGILSDSCWNEGEWTGDFRQQVPDEGASPTQKTEIKILYDDENIYVAIRAHDNEPEKIDRQMGRRDQYVGDKVGVNFDSYFDHRTGFEFNLTAAGCKIDVILTNDGYDATWNPVWDGKTAMEDSAWTAEMSIPLSQLRYGNQQVQVWGLHSWRWINRNQEEDQWNLIPRDNSGPLYYFGELHGLEKLPSVRRIEFLPYSVGKIKTYEKQEGNPFKDGFDPSLTVGLDGKFGIGSNFTVDYTINPDFGQVEADPSELNLTAFETYYNEKRPFFTEGRNIFDFSFDDNQLFYSRRIGHAPTYSPAVDSGEYANIPDNTSILGALKFTGKSTKGLSVGIMESVTSNEYAEISSPGDDYRMIAEPLTNYFVGRVQKDINNSNTMIGGMMTSTYRDIRQVHLNYMNKSAITGGIDVFHYMKDKTFTLDMKALFSSVAGSSEAIAGLQQESSRYFQRPDAPHLKLDTTATRLTGTGGSIELRKVAKGNWRYGIGTHWYSPGMELNDLGFQSSADIFLEGQEIAYVENTPRGIFRNYAITFGQVNFWNFGGEFINAEEDLEAEAMFTNNWEFGAGISRSGKALSANLLRGGPGVSIYGTTSQSYRISTDNAKKLSLSFRYNNSFSDDKVSGRNGFTPGFTWKITNTLNFSTQFSYTKSITDLQYLLYDERIEQGNYLLSRLDRKTYSLTLRINFALSPEFTIQYYGSPYITMGKYSSFKILTDPDTRDPGRVFQKLDAAALTYDETTRMYDLYDGIHPDPAMSFSNPDFNFRQFRSNFVARWEYRPGSLIYLVWTHNRTSSESISNDDVGYNIDNLFNVPAENYFLVKWSYWFSL